MLNGVYKYSRSNGLVIYSMGQCDSTVSIRVL